jgi:DNA anti-recombination protein RmuC
MSTALFPREIKDEWGEKKVKIFVDWLEEFLKEHGVTRDEYRQILSRLDIIENTLEHLIDEQKALRAEMNVRFERINERFDRMNAEMNERFDKMNAEMNERFDRMNAEMNERFDRMNAEMNERFDRMNAEMNGRFDKMNERLESMMKWTVGTIAIFGSLLAILMSIYKFMG